MQKKSQTGLSIRRLTKSDHADIELVAQRMRLTLMEVLGEKTGEEMYSMDWLRLRVLWHLNPEECDGRIFLLEKADGEVIAHTIVRVAVDDLGNEFGLFSTTYVDPHFRKLGAASALIQHGEEWMMSKSMPAAATDTSETNVGLIASFEKRGYKIILREAQMVRLRKEFEQ